MSKRALVALVGLVLGCGVPGAQPCGNGKGPCMGGGTCLGGLCYYDDSDSGSTGGGVAAGGGGGGAATGGGGGGGGDAGVGGGAAPALVSLQFLSPDAGSRSNATTANLIVQAAPAGADAGTVSYSMSLDDGGSAMSGTMTETQPNVFRSAVTGLSEGTWNVVASSGDIDASVAFVIDRTPPTVTLVVEAAPARVVDGGLNGVDPAMGYETAWRRDESAEVAVLASEPVIVTAANIVLDAGVTATTCSQACDAGFCACFLVDLQHVTIPAPGFRGPVGLTLSGVTDLVGNPAGDAGVTVMVTRWKWKKLIAAGATEVQSPALDSSGHVFSGAVLTAVTGGVVGLDPDGTEMFNNASYGAVTAAPMVGAQLYVATKDASLRARCGL